MQNELLCIGSHYQFSTAGALSWTPSTPSTPLNTHHIGNTLQIIEPMLDAIQPEKKSPALDATARCLHTRQDAFQRWLCETSHQVPDSLLPLIGCGNGLTPDGDDYLLGAMVTLKYFQIDKSATLEHWLKQNVPGNTSDISRAHLMAACEGLASEPVHDFLCAVLSPVFNQQRILKYAAAVIAIGHSSGLHTLRGIMAVLKTLVETNTGNNAYPLPVGSHIRNLLKTGS